MTSYRGRWFSFHTTPFSTATTYNPPSAIFLVYLCHNFWLNQYSGFTFMTLYCLQPDRGVCYDYISSVACFLFFRQLIAFFFNIAFCVPLLVSCTLCQNCKVSLKRFKHIKLQFFVFYWRRLTWCCLPAPTWTFRFSWPLFVRTPVSWIPCGILSVASF